jgi:hypothetical protein
VEETSATIVAERDAHIARLTTHLEKALEDKKVATIARAGAETLVDNTTTMLRGLAIRTRQALVTLGLDLPNVPSSPLPGISLWYVDVMERVNSLPERPRQTLQMEGERIVDIIGNTILPRVYFFAPSFLFAQIFKRFGEDPAGKATEEAASPWLEL